MTKITLIHPIISSNWGDETLDIPCNPGTQLQAVFLELGTASIETRLDDDLATPGVIEQAILAEQNGSDAVVINCMDDPGLYAAREAVRIPVVGPAETSMHMAAFLAQRFSWVTTGYNDIPVVKELISRYKMDDRTASVHALDIPVLALKASPEKTLEKFIQCAEAAVRENGAGAIIPGCTLLANMIAEVKAGLAQRDIRIPVLNPLFIAVRLAESLVTLGISQSQRSYPAAANKTIKWYVQSSPILEQAERES